jgi:hypothetical protein
MSVKAYGLLGSSGTRRLNYSGVTNQRNGCSVRADIGKDGYSLPCFLF